MTTPAPFFPQPVYGTPPSHGLPVPRVLIAPHRYIQGPGVLDRLGHFLLLLSSRRPAVIITAGGIRRFGDRIKTAIAQSGAEAHFVPFMGECSYSEVLRVVDQLKDASPQVDSVIAVGGGKCLDAGKCVAFRLGVQATICPTIASTDAPCSAVSVMYSDEGVQVGPEFFPESPALVLVDSQIIVQSPPRQLVAGMGDALATFFEARTCSDNPDARSMVGGRPTMAAVAIARLSADTIMTHGFDALEAMRRREVNDAFEQVVEANTLLSGVGFESGGLSTAHALAAGLTVIPALHSNYLHGELVGIGLLAQLLLENQAEEAQRIAGFLAKVGLPAHAGQLGLDVHADSALLRSAMEEALACRLAESEPFAVTPDKLLAAFLEAHRLGLAVVEQVGDGAFMRLHSNA